MALAYESNTDLAFDTDALRNAGSQYASIAQDLRNLASDLDNALEQLAAKGWSTPAGTAFHEMTQSGWQENIEQYASLLETLNSILTESASEYDELMADYVRVTTVKV